MNTRTVISLGMSALVLGGAMVGCTQHNSIASASIHSAAQAEKTAAVDAAKANGALAKHNPTMAVNFAEGAVALQPDNVSYRVLLGGAYLKAGRFGSAGQAYADVLALDPNNGKAALNLALAQVGSGDWSGARKTLDDHIAIIPASDRGLAMALAGDPNGAVTVLTEAVRDPNADAKTRQNLGLSLALAGRWQDAMTMAAVDLPPADVQGRVQQWAEFANPHAASDQVAALLGVVPVADPGRPIALALNAKVDMTAAAEPVEAVMATPAPEAVAAVEAPAPAADPAPVAEVAVATEAAPAPVASGEPAVHFAARQEVVQPLPVQVAKALVVAVARPVAVAEKSTPKPVASTAKSMAMTKGNFFVQLGAYDNAGVARDAWNRATKSYAAFAGKSPSGAMFTDKGKSFYRLSVGGFARNDANALCIGYRAKGGKCFVRAGAGDQVASWQKQGTEVASR